MPISRLTRHAMSKVGLRVTMHVDDIVAMLDENRCLNVGVSSGDQSIVRLCFNHLAGEFFVAVQNVFTGIVITLHDEESMKRRYLRDELCSKARDLSSGKATPLVSGIPWGYTAGAIDVSVEACDLAAQFVRKGVRGAKAKKHVPLAVLDKWEESDVVSYLSDKQNIETLKAKTERGRHDPDFFGGLCLRPGRKGHWFPLSGGHILKHFETRSTYIATAD